MNSTGLVLDFVWHETVILFQAHLMCQTQIKAMECLMNETLDFGW